MIKLNHLEKYFFKNKKNEIHVINDINLDFPDHGLVVLLGPSGSGKTTLLNVIGGLDKVDKGEIVFQDKVMKGYKAGDWDDIRNERVGYIFQNYNLLPHLSVFENVAFVLRLLGVVDEKIIENNVNYILESVGMYKYRKKKATQLSGGQQQRVAIARALVKNPDIIIADEPTGNLDSKNTFDIMKIVKSISKTKLVVLVTHEKDIANIYGDEIIEVKDGVIENHRKNITNQDVEHIDDNIVYLKDMHQLLDYKDEKFNVKMYHEQENVEPIDVKFFVRNKTLYIDVDSAFKKVKLLDQNSNFLIRDEHYKKMEQEDYIETSFDLNRLDLKDEKIEKKFMVSFKQIISLAFQKIANYGRKGKFLLFVFVAAGSLMALAMALASNLIVANPSNLTYDNDYVIITNTDDLFSYSTSNYTVMPSYDDIQETLKDDEFVNIVPTASFSIVDKQNDTSFLSFSAAIDLIDHLDNPRIKAGEMANSDDEIMISTALADSLFESSLFDFSPNLAQNYGIWSYDDLLKEKILKDDVEYSIAGIIKSDVAVIYVSDTAYSAALATNVEINVDDNNYIVKYRYYNLEDSSLLYGRAPLDDEFVVSNKILIDMELEDYLDSAQSWPVEIQDIGMVSGVVTSNETIAYTTGDTLYEMVYNSYIGSRQTLYIHTDNAKDLIERFETDFNLYGYTEEGYAIAIARYSVGVSFMIPMIIIIFGASFVGFYFLMHSTMISRIYEISVYRSLGMKRRELLISYVVETAFLTTITSVIGYLIASYLLYQIGSSPLAATPFIVNGFTVFIGLIIVYVVNVGAGVIPITLLLRKTPSEISSKFDI